VTSQKTNFLDTSIGELVRDFGGGGQRAVVFQKRLRELVELSREPSQRYEAAEEIHRRLTTLMEARAKLDVVAQLLNRAANDLTGSGLFPHEGVGQAFLGIDAYLRQITSALTSAIESTP
jgi:hypothetical protein